MVQKIHTQMYITTVKQAGREFQYTQGHCNEGTNWGSFLCYGGKLISWLRAGGYLSAATPMLLALHLY